MAGLHERQWMIEVNGQEAGPFTLDELRSLLKEKQILSHFRVRSRLDAASGWNSVEAILQRQSEFVPPQRPTRSTEIVTRITTPSQIALANDPTENLFEALQLAKEKQTGSPTGHHTKTIVRPSGATRFRWGTPLIATAGIAAIALSLTLWSAHQVFTISAGRSISSSPSPQESIADKSGTSGGGEKKVHDSSETSTPRFTIGNPPARPPIAGSDIRRHEPHGSTQEPTNRAVSGEQRPTVIVRTKAANLGQPNAGAMTIATPDGESSGAESTIEEIPPQEIQDTELATEQKANEEKRVNPSAKVISDTVDESDNELSPEDSAENRLVNDFQN